MESHQAESTAAAYITRGLLRHLVEVGVLNREDAQEPNTGSQEQQLLSRECANIRANDRQAQGQQPYTQRCA